MTTTTNTDTNDESSQEEELRDRVRQPLGVSVSELAHADLDPVVPDLVELDGGGWLLYSGQSHSLFGPPGLGKSNTALAICREVVKAGGRCLFLDLEKTERTAADRARSFGFHQEPELGDRIRFQILDGVVGPQLVTAIIDWAGEEDGPVLVVLDSAGRSISRTGSDENSNDAVRCWYDLVIAPLCARGITTLSLDHPVKTFEGGAAGPRGAGAKMDVVTGAAFALSTGRPFSRGQGGYAVLTCTKDNNGGHARRAVAKFVVEPTPGGGIAYEFVAVEGGAEVAIDRAAQWRDRTLAALNSDWQSLTAIRDKVGGGSAGGEAVKGALDALVAEGRVEDQAGKGHQNARNYRLADDSEEADDLDDEVGLAA